MKKRAKRKTIWDRLQGGEIVSERRILQMVRAPKELKTPHWKELLKQRNHDNICEYIKGKGYCHVHIVREWDARQNAYIDYLQVDGLDLGMDFEGTWTPIWEVAVIERILVNRERKLERMLKHKSVKY